MAIEYVGCATANPAGTSYTVDISTLTGGSDTTIRQGDLVVVATGFASTSDGAPGILSRASTTVIDLYSNDGNDSNLLVAYFVAGATPPSSLTMAGVANADGGNATIVAVFRYTDQTNPMDVTAQGATGISSSSANPPAITPASDGALILAVGFAATGSTGTFTGPTGYTNIATAGRTGTPAASTLKLAYLADQPAGVAANPAVMTCSTGGSNSSWAAATLAIKPALVSFLFNPFINQHILVR